MLQEGCGVSGEGTEEGTVYKIIRDIDRIESQNLLSQGRNVND